MSEVITGLASIALSTAAMASLAMQMQRHIAHIWQGRDASLNRQIFRFAGATLLVCAFTVCAREWGAGIGAVMWCAALACGGTLAVLLVTYYPRALPTFGAMAAFFGVALVAFA